MYLDEGCEIMGNTDFILDREFFDGVYLSTFRNRYVLKTAIQFSIALPFQVPFPDCAVVSFPEENSILSYIFSETELEKEYTAGALEKKHSIKYSNTRVEMTLLSNKVFYVLSEKELSGIFNRLLEGLNSFLTAYIIKIKDINVYKVSKEMLEICCLWRRINLDCFTTKEFGLFMLNNNVDHKKEVLNGVSQKEIMDYSIVIQDKANPFILSEELMLSAKRSLTQGFYRECVINAQTSIETFLRTLFKECMKIEGLEDSEIQHRQQNTHFSSLVKKEFSRRLGGSWDITNERKEIGDWYKKCYELRNLIIHSGYDPSFLEVNQSLSAAINFRLFIRNRVEKSPKYKEILKFL